MAVGQGTANVVCGYHAIGGWEYLSYLLVNDFGGDGEMVNISLEELKGLMALRAYSEKVFLGWGKQEYNQLDVLRKEEFNFDYFLDAFVLSHPDADHYQRFVAEIQTTVFHAYDSVWNKDRMVSYSNGDDEFRFKKERYSGYYAYSQSRLSKKSGRNDVYFTFQKKITENGWGGTYKMETQYSVSAKERPGFSIDISAVYDSPRYCLSGTIGGYWLGYIYDNNGNGFMTVWGATSYGYVHMPLCYVPMPLYNDGCICNFITDGLPKLIEEVIASVAPKPLKALYEELAVLWREYINTLNPPVCISCPGIEDIISRGMVQTSCLKLAIRYLYCPHSIYNNKGLWPRAANALFQYSLNQYDVWFVTKVSSPKNMLLKIHPLPDFSGGEYNSFETDNVKRTIWLDAFNNPGKNLYSLTLVLGEHPAIMGVFPGDTTAQGMFYQIYKDTFKELSNHHLLVAPHHGSWKTATGYFHNGSEQIEIIALYLRSVSPNYHLISAGADNRYGHPQKTYVNCAMDTSIDKRLAKSVPHGIYYYDDNGTTSQFYTGNMALFTTWAELNAYPGYISFLFAFDPYTTQAFAYMPSNRGICIPLLAWDDTFPLPTAAPSAPAPPPTAFIFEHRGHTLWQ